MNGILKALKEKKLDERTQRTWLYQASEDLRRGENPSDIIEKIKSAKMGWRREELREIRCKQDEQDDFLVNPFQVEEGVLQCPKCGKNRTFSFQKQTRGADEPMTTFAQCVECKHKWVYSG